MARYRVLLFREDGVPTRHLEETAAWFHRHPGPIVVDPVPDAIPVPLEPSGMASWVSLCFTVAITRRNLDVPADEFVLLLTRSPNEGNWFAVQDPANQRNGFGHVDDFNYVTPAPADVISAHYVIKGVFNVVLAEAGGEPEDRGIEDRLMPPFWHRIPRGCLFDFCQLKTDLGFKLRTADICGDCLEMLRTCRVPDELIRQAVAIMEAQRKTAVSTAPYLEPEAGFARWAFPVAITRHKAVQARNPLLRFLALIDHFDSLVRYCYLVNEVVAGRRPELPDRPSLGWWVDQLARVPGERVANAVRVAESDRVVHLRNERRGHGFVATHEEAYEDDSQLLQEALADIERELRPFFEDYRLLAFRTIVLQDHRYVVEGELLAGSHILHPPYRSELTGDPLQAGLVNQGDVYLELPRGRGYCSMAPFIKATTCPECHMQRILVADGGPRYIDVLVGHRVTLN